MQTVSRLGMMFPSGGNKTSSTSYYDMPEVQVGGYSLADLNRFSGPWK
jgi:hypothetical protein